MTMNLKPEHPQTFYRHVLARLRQRIESDELQPSVRLTGYGEP